MPDRFRDPWQLVNPRVAWVIVIVIAGIGFANDVLLKLYGTHGVYLSGFLERPGEQHCGCDQIGKAAGSRDYVAWRRRRGTLLIIVAIPDHFFPSRSNHHSRTGAARGNVQAARELADRTEGKASQHLEVAGNDYGVYREFSGKRCQVNSKVWIFPASGVGGVASTIRVPSNLIVRIKSVSTQFCMEDIST